MLGAQQGQFEVETINRCLAPCDTCSGSYISMMLVKRLICSCECHQRKKRTQGQARFESDSVTYTAPTVNLTSEKSSLTSWTTERSTKNSPFAEASRDDRIETEEMKEGLRSAPTVGSPQKRQAAVTSKTAEVGDEDTIER